MRISVRVLVKLMAVTVQIELSNLNRVLLHVISSPQTAVATAAGRRQVAETSAARSPPQHVVLCRPPVAVAAEA